MPRLRLESECTASGRIVCTLACADATLAAGYRLCFSLFGPCTAQADCAIADSLGGFIELTPEPQAALAAGASWRFAIAYGYDRAPRNHSWGPTAAYVVTAAGEIEPVETLPMRFAADAYLEPATLPATAPELLLLPTPASWHRTEGVCDLADGIAPPAAGSQAIEAATDSFVELARRCSLPEMFKPGSDKQLSGAVDDDLASPAYRLTIRADGIDITAADSAGLQHALASLAQLRVCYDGKIPCGEIADAPRFGWRGMHLDCARHYYGVPTLLRLLDLLALLKFNVFHWHLIDDEAFRLELDSFPQLARQTAMRGRGCLMPGVFGGGAGPTGGFYSKSDVATVVEHAGRLGIEVMPEIELPAHCWSLLQAMPEMRDPQDASAAFSVQGYPDNVLNPAMPATWQFIEKAIPDIVAMFPAQVVHLGCDERPPGSWTRSPALDKWMAANQLADATDVQELMMRKAAEIVRACGARPAAWEEAAQGRNGGIGGDSLLFSWSGQQPGLDAARAGYDVVMCPGQHVYLDMAPSADPRERGTDWAALVALADTIAWEPAPASAPELDKRIVGVQGALWSESVLADKDMEAMLAPRLLGIAEMAWAWRDRRLPADALRHMARLWRPQFAAMDWLTGSCD